MKTKYYRVEYFYASKWCHHREANSLRQAKSDLREARKLDLGTSRFRIVKREITDTVVEEVKP